MKFVKSLLVSAALAASFGANAQVVGTLGGGYGSFLALSSNSLGSPAIATILGGTVYNSDFTFASIPEGTTIFGGKFLAAGVAATEPAVITFTSPTSYISFLWGSPDVENVLTVKTSAGTTQTFTPSSMSFAVTDGQQSFSQYVQFAAAAGTTITSLSFNNIPARDAFEAANFSVTPVPEPETYALMLAGLGAMAFVARRRKNA